MQNTEEKIEQSFTKLFQLLRQATLGEMGLRRVLVTKKPVKRFIWWYALLPIGAFALILVMFGYSGRNTLDTETDILAMEIEAEEIRNQVELDLPLIEEDNIDQLEINLNN